MKPALPEPSSDVVFRARLTAASAWIWFPDLDVYTRSVPCAACKVRADQPCRRGTPCQARSARAMSRRNRDVGAAPWPEYRVPGVNYSSLPSWSPACRETSDVQL